MSFTILVTDNKYTLFMSVTIISPPCSHQGGRNKGGKQKKSKKKRRRKNILIRRIADARNNRNFLW